MNTSKLTDEIFAIIKSCYKILTNKEVIEEIQKVYPDFTANPCWVKNILRRYNIQRTAEDHKNVTKRLVELGVKKKALEKGHITRGSRVVGEVYFMSFQKKPHNWYIITPKGPRVYAKYLYKKHFGKIPYLSKVEWIDLNKKPTIDNIRVVPKDMGQMKIGSTCKWIHEGHLREFIKTGPAKFELLLPYIWRQAGREIIPGMWIAKIDPDGPAVIENLQMIRSYAIDSGAQNLSDWFIKMVLTKRGFKPEDITEEDIKFQRTILELKRAIKENDEHSRSNSSDPSMEGPSTEHD